jgi:hypothetical protein
MGTGRGMLIAITLLAVGGAALIWGSGREGLVAVGWVTLAAIAGLIATRRTGRFIIAGIVLIGAGVVLWQVLAGESAAAPRLWGSVGGVAAFGAAVMILRWGTQWPSLGARYERSTPRAVDPWSELDAGRDPTLSDTERDT